MKKLIAVLLLCTLACSTAVFAQSQIDRGKELLSQGKATAAVVVLREFLATNPKSIEAWLSLGRAYINLSNLDSAKLAGERVISLDEANVEGYLLKAKAEKAQKDINGAQNTLTSGLTERKNDPRLLTELGFLLLDADSVDRAIVALTRAKEANPNSAVVYEGLGEAYSRQGVTAFAITQYEKSIELDPSRADVHYRLGKLYYKERRYNDAARAYNQVATIDTMNRPVLLELARMYMISRPKQYDNAAVILRKYVQRFPNADDVWGTYTEALFYTRQYDDAIDAAGRALKTDPKSGGAYRFMAISQYRLRQYKESVESFGKLRTVDTLKVEDLRYLADSYERLKKDTLAVSTYEELLSLNPSQSEVYADAGAAYMRLRNWDRAAFMFQRRFTLDTSAVALSSYVNFALCKMALQENDTARIALRHFTVKRPEYAPGHLYLGRVLVAVDSFPAARNSYQNWLKLVQGEESKYKRELAEAYKIIGVSYLLEKKYQDAIEYLKKSVGYRDDDWQPHLWLGQANAMSNNKEEAIKEYQKVLKLDPKNKDAKNGLELLGIPVD